MRYLLLRARAWFYSFNVGFCIRVFVFFVCGMHSNPKQNTWTYKVSQPSSNSNLNLHLSRSLACLLHFIFEHTHKHTHFNTILSCMCVCACARGNMWIDWNVHHAFWLAFFSFSSLYRRVSHCHCGSRRRRRHRHRHLFGCHWQCFKRYLISTLFHSVIYVSTLFNQALFAWHNLNRCRAYLLMFHCFVHNKHTHGHRHRQPLTFNSQSPA